MRHHLTRWLVNSPDNYPSGAKVALRITLLYAGISALWILLSDSAVAKLFSSTDGIRTASIIKGWLFVLVTSLLLFSLIRRSVRALSASQMTLLDSERRLSGIISFLPDATFVVDMAGKVIAWNRAMEALSGVKAEDMVGKGDYAYAQPFGGERHPMLIDYVLHPDIKLEDRYKLIHREGNAVVVEMFMDRIRPGGGWLRASATVLYDSSGKKVGAIETIRDVTDLRRAEQERLEQVERERQIEMKAEEAKRQFYQRTVFAVTNGRLNLVDYSDIEAMIRQDARKVAICLASDIARAREIIKQMAASINMSEDNLYGLITAFNEAAANAIKHAKGGTAIVQCAPGMLQVFVLDSGSGMEELILPKATLMARFSTKTSMGLGYSLILGLVDIVYLATGNLGTSIMMEQHIKEPLSEIDLASLPDTW